MRDNLISKNHGEVINLLLALGNAYFEKGEYTRATEKFQQLVNIGYTDAEIYLKLAKCLIQQNRFDSQAINIYSETIRSNPDDLEFLKELVPKLIEKKIENANVQMILEKALLKPLPFVNQIAEKLSQLYFQNRQYYKCQLVTRYLLKKEGFLPRAFSLFIQSSWQIGDFDDSLNLLYDLIKTSKNKFIILKYICATILEKYFHNNHLRPGKREVQIIKHFLNLESLQKKFQNLVLALDLQKFLGEFTDRSNKELEKYTQQLLAHLVAFQFKEGLHSIKLMNNDLISGNILAIYLKNYDYTKAKYGSEYAQLLKKSLTELIKDTAWKFPIENILLAEDGCLIFSENMARLLDFSRDLLKRTYRLNLISEDYEKLNINLGITNGQDVKTHNQNIKGPSFDAIHLAVKLSTLSPDNIFNTPEGKDLFNKNNRILITHLAFQQLNNKNNYRVHLLNDLHIKYFKQPFSLLEVFWHDPIDELNFGFIKNFSRYELLEDLTGHNEFKTFKARDPVLQRFVIVKIVQSSQFNNLPAQHEVRIEFTNYLKNLGKLQHANLAIIYEYGEENGLSYFIREYVEGVPINQTFSEIEQFDRDRFIHLVSQLGKSVIYCHDKKFCHLNLSPSNILVCDQDNIKLMDFKIDATSLPWEENPAKVYYLAPEQVKNQTGDQRSDIFTLGLIFYEMATGVHPFAEGDPQDIAEAILYKHVEPPSHLNKNFPAEHDNWIMKCLEKDPEKRFQTVHELMKVIKKYTHAKFPLNFNAPVQINLT